LSTLHNEEYAHKSYQVEILLEEMAGVVLEDWGDYMVSAS
jgi:hypothetical protein